MTAPKLPEGLEPVAWRYRAFNPFTIAGVHVQSATWSLVAGPKLMDSFSSSMGEVPEPLYTATQMREAILAATERAAKTVPTNWVDSILTGPNRVPGIDKVDCRTFEALLCRIAAAIRGDGGQT